MAVTITLANDNNHSISSTKKILSRQGELGEKITFSVPTALAATYGLAWIMVQQPDGQLYYIDNGSATGFDHATTDSFTYAIGDRDTMLSVDGTLRLQVVLRDDVPPAQTVEWRSRILELTVEGSILSNTDSGGSLIDSLSSGTLDRLADIQYDSLGDGDLLYRDTTTGKWRNVTLVDGANISHVLNKATGELTLQATGNISTLASDTVYIDAGGYFTGSDGETISQEIGASLALKANLASPTFTGTPAAPTAAVSTNTTQIATTAFVNAEISGDVGVANSALVKAALNASGNAPIYACRAWCVFSGSGSLIGGSGISSIVDTGNGITTINFLVPMVVYAVVASPFRNTDPYVTVVHVVGKSSTHCVLYSTAIAANYVQREDAVETYVAIFS